MKKTAFVLMVIVFTCALGITILQIAQGTTHTNIGVTRGSVGAVHSELRVHKIDFDNDVNNVTVSIPSIFGYVDGIVIDSNGTDTSFSVVLRDEHDCNIFFKADCNSVIEPHRHAITIIDSNGVHGATPAAYLGAPVSGICDVVLTDANDATMDDLQIYIYYRDYRYE